jgi:hypothetical protein
MPKQHDEHEASARLSTEWLEPRISFLGRMRHRIKVDDGNQLIIELTYTAKKLLILCVIAIPIIPYLAFTYGPHWTFAVFVSLFPFAGIIPLLDAHGMDKEMQPYIEMDRAKRIMRFHVYNLVTDDGRKPDAIGFTGSLWTLDFDDIVGVQMLRKRKFIQMNLVLAGEQPNRLNLFNHKGRRKLERIAERLADALDVPLTRHNP